jgi:hypothetical protein
VYCSAFVLDMFYAHYIFAVVLIFIAALYFCRKVLVLYLYVVVLFAAVADATELWQLVVVLVPSVYLV